MKQQAVAAFTWALADSCHCALRKLPHPQAPQAGPGPSRHSFTWRFQVWGMEKVYLLWHAALLCPLTDLYPSAFKQKQDDGPIKYHVSRPWSFLKETIFFQSMFCQWWRTPRLFHHMEPHHNPGRTCSHWKGLWTAHIYIVFLWTPQYGFQVDLCQVSTGQPKVHKCHLNKGESANSLPWRVI